MGNLTEEPLNLILPIKAFSICCLACPHEIKLPSYEEGQLTELKMKNFNQQQAIINVIERTVRMLATTGKVWVKRCPPASSPPIVRVRLTLPPPPPPSPPPRRSPPRAKQKEPPKYKIKFSTCTVMYKPAKPVYEDYKTTKNVTTASIRRRSTYF